MIKKNIVVVGYPKSGTTWVSRLVAELVQCPLEGNWGFDNSMSPIKEGQRRYSEFKCYKSHHQYNEVFNVNNKNIYKLIYVIRDPRDIVISGVHHFSFLNYFLKKIRSLGSYSERSINCIVPQKYKKQKMIKAVLFGNEEISDWYKVSWKEHYLPYLRNEVLFVSFEKMILNPIKECNKILNELQIFRSREQIFDSIKSQSFDVKKTEFTNDKINQNLLRKGEYGYWKNEFTYADKQLFIQNLNEEFDFFDFHSGIS